MIIMKLSVIISLPRFLYSINSETLDFVPTMRWDSVLLDSMNSIIITIKVI